VLKTITPFFVDIIMRVLGFIEQIIKLIEIEIFFQAQKRISPYQIQRLKQLSTVTNIERLAFSALLNIGVILTLNPW
jgi:hypothetical protein